MTISQTITDFVTLAIQAGGWMELDRLYLQNRVLAVIGEESIEPVSPTKVSKTSLELLDELVVQAIKNGSVKEKTADIEILEAQLMDFLTPPPSVVNAFFAQHYEKDPVAATDYFYKLTKENDYIKTRATTKNIVFPAETDYGQLEITIKLSRLEKDPKQMTAAQMEYPMCVLCMENEGYKGRKNYPVRTNHRIIRMNLDGESWGFQYSPYAYYNEQSIISSEAHRPMVLSKATFRQLMRITEVLPHYFVGAKANLPIVAHAHYQAGHQVCPIEKATIETYFELSAYPLMNAGILKWPMSVIRLQSPNSEDLVEAAELILNKWSSYSDEKASVHAFSGDRIPRHTLLSIARRKGQLVELDLILRDHTNFSEHPSAIFDPQQDIGLMEAMGLAVLPSRVKDELKEVANYVLKKDNQLADYHKKWADQMKETYLFNEKNVEAIIQKGVGQIFASFLADASVFKKSIEGQAAFKRFIDSL